MQNFKTVLSFEWLKLKRSKGSWILSILCLIFGLYALQYGHSEIQRQRNNLSELVNIQKDTISELKQKFPDNNLAGDIPYYFPVYIGNEPHALAPFSIGQRDVNPYHLKLRLLALEGQLYDSDTINPLKALNGNFDFSFLVVFVVPLLVIALTFNVYSEEKEQGTLALLLSNPIRLRTLIVAKLLIRFLVVAALLSFIYFLGVVLFNVDFGAEVWALYLSILLYVGVWFSFSFLNISFKKDSAFNGVFLLGGWLFFVIVLPGMLNIISGFGNEGQKGIEVTLDQRESVHSGWDSDKDKTLDTFFTRYPAYAAYRPKTDSFSWAWYFANQEVGDMKSSEKVEGYDRQLGEILAKGNELETFSPAITLLNLFNKYARSDLETHMAFLNSARDFHQSFKNFFYPYIFTNAPFPHADYDKIPLGKFDSSTIERSGSEGMLKLFIFCILFSGLGMIIFNRNQNIN